jgi:hypothetical protein
VLAPVIGNSPVMAELGRTLNINGVPAVTNAVQSLIDAINGAIGSVVAIFPTSTMGGVTYILKDTLNADGSVSVRAFSTTQTAGLRTALQAVVDAIN